MLIKPPPIDQPQQVNENPSNTSLEAVGLQGKVLNSPQERSDIAPSVNSIVNKEDKEIIIRKKAQYRAFMKLIKDKKYTSAVLTSRILGVDRNTLTSWLQTKAVRELMQSTYEDYVSDIAKAKDWKAKAYLLDKLEDKDNLKENTTSLTNLIQINVLSK